MNGTCAVAPPAPLDYRYALDAAMAALGGVHAPVVLCNVPQLEHEARQRVPDWSGMHMTSAALWVEPLAESWRDDLMTLADVLSPGGRLAVVASRPLALILPERRTWDRSPLGLRPLGVGRLQRALRQTGLTLDATYGLHSALAVSLSLLSRLAEGWGRPDLGDRLHFAARLRYCSTGPLASLSTVALLTATKEHA